MSLARPSIPVRSLLPSMRYIRRNRVPYSRATGVERKISTVSGCSSLICKTERQATTVWRNLESSYWKTTRDKDDTDTGPMGMQYFPKIIN